MPAPPPLDGLSATGRTARAPGVDVFEYAAGNGLKHLALQVHEPWRLHPSLGPDLQGRLGFMEAPEVGGLARLATFDAESTTFVYPTGTVWSVAEIVRVFADTGSAAGVKAGLELCYLVAESLVEAAESGFSQGLSGHGNVTPWSLWLKADGQPLVLGYGIPQVELLTWRENPKLQLGEDSYRYAPPERVEGGGEDVSSDLLSLALVCLELMTGRPVYDGVVADVRQQASRGEGVRRLYQWRDKLPQNVREVMSRALKADPDTRFPTGMDFVHAVHDLLGSIDVEGPSLVEVMARVRAMERRGRAAGKTGALSPAEMAELAADLEDFEERPLPPPRHGKEVVELNETPIERPRWGKVQRPPGPAAPATEGDRPRRRLRGDGPPTGTINTSTLGRSSGTANAAAGDDAARDRLRRRLRESAPLNDGRGGGSQESGELDLSAPDDVQLEPVTGKASLDEEVVAEPVAPQTSTGRVLPSARAPTTPAPAAPRRAPPAAAAPPAPARPAPSPPAPAPAAPPALSPPAPAAAAPPVPPPTVPVVAVPTSEPAAPKASAPPVEAPQADGAQVSSAAALLERLRTSGGRRRRSNGETSQALPLPAATPPVPAGAPSPVGAPPQRFVEVWVADTVARVAPGLARDIAARVVAELGLPQFDLTGRFAGAWRLFRAESPVPPGSQVEPTSGLHLRRIRTGCRPIRIELGDGRTVELPVEVGLNARGLLVGLAEWGLRADPSGAVWHEGRALAAQETLAEALEESRADPAGVPLVSIRPIQVS